ncbi:RING finger family 4 domain-containing protein, partial [Actinoplanes nipponensis]
MDAFAVVLLRRTARVAVAAAGPGPADGAAWAGALEADLAERGWLLHRELWSAAAQLTPPLRVQWADWLLATVDELTGADRTMVPLYRSFPDTPRNPEAVFVRRLLTHLLAVPGAPCVLCGREQDGEPLDPCGHPVCRSCFAPEEFSACPICGRRPAAGTPYLPMVAPAGPPAAGPPVRVRLLRLEHDPAAAATKLRDELVARPGALGEADRADLAVLIKATAPAELGWLPATVPARETLALVLAWALHATALTEAYPEVLAETRRRWQTATDVARTLWAYSGGDAGLNLPARADGPSAPGEAWRPVDEPATPVPVTRVRALPRALRRAALGRLDACGAGAAAEDLRRHPAVWKRLGERLHPYERVPAHPGAAVAFAALRGTRTARDSALGAAMVAAGAEDPRRLVLTDHPDGTVTVRLRTHAALVERAFADGDAGRAARLLAERPGELWRRVDQLLRTTGPDGHEGLTGVLRDSAGRVAPGVLAAAAAELAGRDETVAATEEQLAAVAAARAAAMVRAQGAGRPAGGPVSVDPAGTSIGRAFRAAFETLSRRFAGPGAGAVPGAAGPGAGAVPGAAGPSAGAAAGGAGPSAGAVPGADVGVPGAAGAVAGAGAEA